MLWKQGTAGAVPAADAITRYTYTPAGQIDSVSDSAGNSWSYKYDLLGEKTSQTDPNTGTTSFDKYDVQGNLLQTTDPRGQTLSYSYDWDNRVTAEYAAPWSATPDPAKQQSSRVYDTLAKGYPTSSTRYVGGAASGSAYTEAVTGYNTAYQPLGSTLTIPAADGFPGTAGKDSGTVTYTLTSTYTPNTACWRRPSTRRTAACRPNASATATRCRARWTVSAATSTRPTRPHIWTARSTTPSAGSCRPTTAPRARSWPPSPSTT